MNIKTPPMPKPVGYTSRSWLVNKGGGQFSSIRVVGLELPIHTADQLSARDQQWIEMVRPVVEASSRVLDWLDSPCDSALSDSELEALRAALSQIKGE